MFDTIILLTGPVEQAVLASALLGHHPKLTLAVAPPQVRYQRRPGLRSIVRLPVRAGD